jgi:Flp pilus assembly pilin Flp
MGLISVDARRLVERGRHGLEAGQQRDRDERHAAPDVGEGDADPRHGRVAEEVDVAADEPHACVTFANIWRGVPFIAITLLAGLQTVSPSLYEAASPMRRSDHEMIENWLSKIHQKASADSTVGTTQGADLRHLRQHLARRAVHRDHAAGRPPDRVALALRGLLLMSPMRRSDHEMIENWLSKIHQKASADSTVGGVPFIAITLLAGLQTVSPSLYEAASIDGATPWQG